MTQTARQAGAEAAYQLVENREMCAIWMDCFTALLHGSAWVAINSANEAYKAILDLAQEHRDSLVVR
jgi:hypothetical protein